MEDYVFDSVSSKEVTVLSKTRSRARHMEEIAEDPDVQLLTRTRFVGISEAWESDAEVDGLKVIEAAGRQCYESWSKPNPQTAKNADYIRSLITKGHYSVLEHVDVAFRIRKVSRVLSHQLVRHRHLCFSQRSERFVDEDDCTIIIPSIINDDPELRDAFLRSVRDARETYRYLKTKLREKLRDFPDKTLQKKMANEAARYVLPNATETRLVMSGNLRAWRHFVHMRSALAAGPEIRKLALKVLRILQDEYPAVFQDFHVKVGTDGTEYAESVHHEM